jgi:hypothetical protein
MKTQADCKCTSRFTCGNCLRNAKPYFYTLSDGSAIVVGPLQGTKPVAAVPPDSPGESK